MIKLYNVHKTYNSGGVPLGVTNDLSVRINKGDFAILLGESGTGKSTLLNIISGLETVDSGIVVVNDQVISHLSQKSLADFRKENLGFVFQSYNLIPNLTAEENVKLVAKMSPNSLDPVEVLTRVGLGQRLSNFPSQLSGGEQQRVSIARALVKKPQVLLCDEPTGALDNKTSIEILSLLQSLTENKETTVLMVTHNRSIVAMGNHIIELSDGEIVEESRNNQPKKVEHLKS